MEDAIMCRGSRRSLRGMETKNRCTAAFSRNRLNKITLSPVAGKQIETGDAIFDRSQLEKADDVSADDIFIDRTIL